MANYNCTIRTNYFHVKDADAFRALMSRAYGTEDDIQLWEKTDKQGNLMFGFGLHSAIAGVRNAKDDECEDADESAYDEFISGLQACIADDDAIIIMEAGHEKLCYVVGSATVITSTELKYLDMTTLAMEAATALLKNPNWMTRCDY